MTLEEFVKIAKKANEADNRPKEEWQLLRDRIKNETSIDGYKQVCLDVFRFLKSNSSQKDKDHLRPYIEIMLMTMDSMDSKFVDKLIGT